MNELFPMLGPYFWWIVAGLLLIAEMMQPGFFMIWLAAAVTLGLNPRAAGEPGWQLSFVAVIGLLALAPGLRGALTRRGWPELAADAVAITVAATVATAPLLALHFGEVSLSGAVNATPLMGPRLKEAQKLGFRQAVVPARGEIDGAAAKLKLGRIAHLRELADGGPPCD